jgi:hypothetical protein
VYAPAEIAPANTRPNWNGLLDAEFASSGGMAQ